MGKNIDDQLSPEVKRKKSTNLLWVGILSIVMLFAGLTSAYIVSSGDGFWVKIAMPEAFWWSTAIIIISSITINFAVVFAKRNKKNLVKIFTGLTLMFGVTFMVLQYKGWGQLIDRGHYFVNNVVPPGKYGAYFTLEYQGKEVGFDGRKYYLEDQVMPEDVNDEMVQFAENLSDVNLRLDKSDYGLPGFEQFSVMLKGEELIQKDSTLYQSFNDSLVPLSYQQRKELQNFAENIEKGRGDFMMTGEYGKDFTILYKEQPLTYKNRKLYLGDEELGKGEYAELYRQKNTSSSYLYILTVLHFLHVLGGIIYLSRLSVGAVRAKYDSDNYLNVKLGAIYWHFVDALWVYLFLFLTFIH